MFRLPIGWHSEGGERVGKKWGKCQGLIYPDLGRHREASSTSSTTEGRKVTGHDPTFLRLLLMGADHESLAGLERFKVTQELLPALVGSRSMESLGSPHWSLHRQGGTLWQLADSQACGQVTASEAIRVWPQFFKGAATVLALDPMRSSGLL